MKDDSLITVLAVVGIVAVGAYLLSKRTMGTTPASSIPLGQTLDPPDPAGDLFARLKGWLNPNTRADGSLKVTRVQVTDTASNTDENATWPDLQLKLDRNWSV